MNNFSSHEEEHEMSAIQNIIPHADTPSQVTSAVGFDRVQAPVASADLVDCGGSQKTIITTVGN